MHACRHPRIHRWMRGCDARCPPARRRTHAPPRTTTIYLAPSAFGQWSYQQCVLKARGVKPCSAVKSCTARRVSACVSRACGWPRTVRHPPAPSLSPPRRHLAEIVRHLDPRHRDTDLLKVHRPARTQLVHDLLHPCRAALGACHHEHVPCPRPARTARQLVAALSHAPSLAIARSHSPARSLGARALSLALSLAHSLSPLSGGREARARLTGMGAHRKPRPRKRPSSVSKPDNRERSTSTAGDTASPASTGIPSPPTPCGVATSG